MSFADDATRAMRDRARAEFGFGYDHGTGHDYGGYSDGSPGSSGFHPAESVFGSARVGFTTPSVIYDRMRQIEDAVTALDRDVRRNVAPIPATENFRLAWTAYVTRWRAFFDRTMSFREKLLGTPLRSDEVRDQANQFALELERFTETYKLQPGIDGQPVPPPSGGGLPAPLPERPSSGGPKPDEPSFWAQIPWWGYALAVAFTGAVGYSFYRAAQHASRREEQLFQQLPNMMGWTSGRDQAPPVVVNVAAPAAPPVAPAGGSSP